MIQLRVGSANVIYTGRAEGDMGRAAPEGLATDYVARREALLPPKLKWRWMHQVHDENDYLVTGQTDVVLSISTADCGALALASDNGRIAMAHVGWAGLEAGVVEKAVGELGGGEIIAALGPCIAQQPNAPDRPDLRDGIATRLDALAVGLAYCCEVDTSTSDDYFSHRARKDPQRQVGAIWLD